jgi:flavin-dependent dehydrogenase
VNRALIVGGGPAGAFCGELLARGGWQVTLFDAHLAWEKPCGGGLTARALRAYPFLDNPGWPHRHIHRVELTTPSGDRAALTLREPLVIYSRQTLNRLLLERSRQAGCRLVRTRVRRVYAGHWPVRVETEAGRFEGDFAVIATGARNRFLLDTTPLRPQDYQQTLGYFIPVRSDVLKIRFLPGFQGYIWSFPRVDHLSVGICGPLSAASSATLRVQLDAFLRDEGLCTAGAQFYSHLLPSPQAATLRRRPIAGMNWALIGDAAATVDPITGEGLYYALRSGELLARALLAGAPAEYAPRLREEFGQELERAAELCPRFYLGNFLGRPVTVRTVQFARDSARFQHLLGDLFAGLQDYASLPARLWQQLPATLAELAASWLRRRHPIRTGRAPREIGKDFR